MTPEEKKERARARCRAYYARNREAQIARCREYRRAHRAELAEKEKAKRATPCYREAKRAAEARRRERVRSGEVEVKHGTLYGYNSGCRCDECREAMSKYTKAARAKLREQAEKWDDGIVVFHVPGRRTGAIRMEGR